MSCWLVVWNMIFFFPYIGNVIIQPTLIFFRGVDQPPTSMSSCCATEAQAGRLLFLAYVLLGDFLTFDWQLGQPWANCWRPFDRHCLGRADVGKFTNCGGYLWIYRTNDDCLISQLIPSGKHTKKLWKITNFNGKTHYFNGHVQ